MWKNTDKMFPEGYIPFNDDLTVEDLDNEDYDAISFLSRRMARGMVYCIDKETWTPEGAHIIENTYHVYHYPCPDGTPHLSVFGAKMLNNYRDRKESKDHDTGFNYTGI